MASSTGPADLTKLFSSSTSNNIPAAANPFNSTNPIPAAATASTAPPPSATHLLNTTYGSLPPYHLYQDVLPTHPAGFYFDRPSSNPGLPLNHAAPFWAPRSRTHELNMIDGQFTGNPFLSAANSGKRRGWDGRETQGSIGVHYVDCNGGFGFDVCRSYPGPSAGSLDGFSFPPGVIHPFSSPRSHSYQVLNMMDPFFMDIINPYNPFLFVANSGRKRRSYETSETEEALNLSVELPGVDKEDVKVTVEKNSLIIKGESKKESDDDNEKGRKYSSRFDLAEKVYKTGEVKAEMKNGLLKVVIPKVKKEERTDVFQVKVE